mgnify:CR=1 FL=1
MSKALKDILDIKATLRNSISLSKEQEIKVIEVKKNDMQLIN